MASWHIQTQERNIDWWNYDIYKCCKVTLQRKGKREEKNYNKTRKNYSNKEGLNPIFWSSKSQERAQEGENALKMHMLGSNFYLFNFISFIDKKPSSDSLQAISSSLLLFKTLGKISRHKEEKEPKRVLNK